MDLSAHFNTTLILSAYEPATWYTSTIQTGNPLANSPEGGVFTFSGNSYSIKSICQQSQNSRDNLFALDDPGRSALQTAK